MPQNGVKGPFTYDVCSFIEEGVTPNPACNEGGRVSHIRTINANKGEKVENKFLLEQTS